MKKEILLWLSMLLTWEQSIVNWSQLKNDSTEKSIFYNFSEKTKINEKNTVSSQKFL